MNAFPPVITDRMSVVVIANNRAPESATNEGLARMIRENAAAQLDELTKAFPGVECRVAFDGVPVAGFVPA